jgi:uncharacterized protein YdeI (YjbR/CyaY-like superfamily)
MKPIFFKSTTEFRKWLKKNHAKETELWVGFWKLHTGKPSMTWSEAVDVALCFGWIDGIRKSIDADSYTNRFTPRRPGSNWSAINIAKVEALKKQGLMEVAGLAAYGLRKDEKSKVYSYENEQGKLRADMQKLFKANKAAWKFFTAHAPSYQRLMVHHVMSAKKEETRLNRLKKLVAASAEGKRVM